MPSRSPRVCNKPGCGRKTLGKYCEKCEPTERNSYDRTRGSSTERGYGRRWREYALWFLNLPENRICKCGCGRMSKEVDHIVPISGPDDPLFWESSNHQGLTKECHSEKTMRETRARQNASKD